MSDLIILEPGTMVDKWKIEKKLGEGAFSAVYQCTCDGKMYALKTEGRKEKIRLLIMEVFVLLEIAKLNDGNRHFCKFEAKGQCETFNYIVMTFVGKSLHDLRLSQPKRKFSMGTAISIGIQCLEALEDLHTIGYLHRDVKPANYTIGRPDMNELRKVYVLDFGMARKFVHENGTMRKPRTSAGFFGTAKYAPISCHKKRELCRKDDVESWLYMIVEITRGKLPWKNIEDQDEVAELKKLCRKEQSVKKLFSGCPRQYIDIMRLTDSWKFFDAPDYEKLYKLMKEAMVSTKSQEHPYDWEPEAIKKADEIAKAKKLDGKKDTSSSDSEKADKKKRKEKQQQQQLDNKENEKVKNHHLDKENDKEKKDGDGEDKKNKKVVESPKKEKKKDESPKKKKKDDDHVQQLPTPEKEKLLNQ